MIGLTLLFVASASSCAQAVPRAATLEVLCEELTMATGHVHTADSRLAQIPLVYRLSRPEQPRNRNLIASAVRGRWVLGRDGSSWALEDDPSRDADLRRELERAVASKLGDELRRGAQAWASERERERLAQDAWSELQNRWDKFVATRRVEPEDHEPVRGPTHYLARWLLDHIGEEVLLRIPIGGRLAWSTSRSSLTSEFPIDLEPELKRHWYVTQALAGFVADTTRDGSVDGWLFSYEVLHDARAVARATNALLIVNRGRHTIAGELTLIDANGGISGSSRFQIPLKLPPLSDLENLSGRDRLGSFASSEVTTGFVAPGTPQERALARLAAKDISGAADALRELGAQDNVRQPWALAYIPELLHETIEGLEKQDFVAWVPDGIGARIVRQVTGEGVPKKALDLEPGDWDELLVEKTPDGWAIYPLDVPGGRREQLSERFIDQLFERSLTKGELDGLDWIALASIECDLVRGRMFFAVVRRLIEAGVSGANTSPLLAVYAAMGELKAMGRRRLPVDAHYAALSPKVRQGLHALLYGEAFSVRVPEGVQPQFGSAYFLHPTGVPAFTPLRLVALSERVVRLSVDGRHSRWYGQGELTRHSDDGQELRRWQRGERPVYRLILEGFEEPTFPWVLGVGKVSTSGDQVRFGEAMQWINAGP